MNKNIQKSKLLPEAQKRLKRLSEERLKVANDFLSYLEDRESSDATRELLNIQGFEEALHRALEQVDKDELISLREVERDV